MEYTGFSTSIAKRPVGLPTEEPTTGQGMPIEKTKVNPTYGASSARRTGEGNVQRSATDIPRDDTAADRSRRPVTKRPSEITADELIAANRPPPKHRKIQALSVSSLGHLNRQKNLTTVAIDSRRLVHSFAGNREPTLTSRRAKKERSRCPPYENYGYIDVKPIGEGGNGRVVMVKRKLDGLLRARKTIKWPSTEPKPPIEVYILRDLIPPNNGVTRIHSAFWDGASYNIFMDCFNGGDLSRLISFYKGKTIDVPESFLWHASHQLFDALAFIQQEFTTQPPHLPDSRSVIHADIKPEKVLLRYGQDPSQYPSLVLSDFGSASVYGPGPTLIGTHMYQPPELPNYSKEGDVWATGATLYSRKL